MADEAPKRAPNERIPTIPYASCKEPAHSTGRMLLVVFGLPLAIALMFACELLYVRLAGLRTASGRVAPFISIMALAELGVLLVWLCNTVLMHWHLSALRAYRQARPIIKVLLFLVSAAANLVAVAGAAWIFLMAHMV